MSGLALWLVAAEGLPADRHGDALRPEEDSVAWLTHMQASAKAPVSYVAPTTPMQEAVSRPSAAFLQQTGANVCRAPNTEMQTDDGCRLLCEKNMTDPNDHAKLKELEAADPRMLCDPDYCRCYNPKVPKEVLVKKVLEEGQRKPGLPDCEWIAPDGCTTESQYECLSGPKAGQCSAHNWFDRPDQCHGSCIHTLLFWFAPHNDKKGWIMGPDDPNAKKDKEEVSENTGQWQPDASPDDEKLDVKVNPNEVPHYDHDKAKLSLESRSIEISDLDVMMSPACKQKQPKFVAVTMYSPKLEKKATRLLTSCERQNICCKATRMIGQFGKGSSAIKEGSDEFHLEMIRMKPAFILSQMDRIRLPIVWLDCDMEFHKFPKLFLPGSWPLGARDMLLFNSVGNDTKGQDNPQVVSGVAFFNYTSAAKNLLVAWSEAMAYELNAEAPDDWVLGELLGGGSWVKRATYGWLPSSYMRHLPANYRGVDPVIDCDHGSLPGIDGHSDALPNLPPVKVPEKEKELPKFLVK